MTSCDTRIAIDLRTRIVGGFDSGPARVDSRYDFATDVCQKRSCIKETMSFLIFVGIQLLAECLNRRS